MLCEFSFDLRGIRVRGANRQEKPSIISIFVGDLEDSVLNLVELHVVFGLD